MWYSSENDDRGIQIKLLIAEADLGVVNIPGQVSTYQGRAEASSNIGVTLANALMAGRISGWKMEDYLTMNDHKIVHTDIKNMQVEGDATHNMV